jgi:hypothetical protein
VGRASTYKRIVRQLVTTRAGDGNRTRTASLGTSLVGLDRSGVNQPAMTGVF